MQTQTAEFRARADRAPAIREHPGTSAFGMARKQKRVRVGGTGQRRDEPAAYGQTGEQHEARQGVRYGEMAKAVFTEMFSALQIGPVLASRITTCRHT